MTRPGHWIPLHIAQGIDADSWLNEPRFEAFRAGYSYAASATHAISGLSKLTAEETYYVWSLISRGVALHEGTEPRP